MPLSKFLCASCSQEFELFLRPSEIGTAVKCPLCQAETRVSEPVQPETDPAGSGECGPNKVT